MSETFNRYIRDGRKAVETHPDLRPSGVEFETAAVDTIASVLHALDADAGLTPELARFRAGSMDGVLRGERFATLERAWRSYVGDFEDIERGYSEDASHGASCAQRFAGAAECTCGKADAIHEHELGGEA